MLRRYSVVATMSVGFAFVLFNFVGIPTFFGRGQGFNQYGWPFTYAVSDLTEQQLREDVLFRKTGMIHYSGGEFIWDANVAGRLNIVSATGNFLTCATGLIWCYFCLSRWFSDGMNVRLSLANLLAFLMIVAILIRLINSSFLVSMYLRHFYLIRLGFLAFLILSTLVGVAGILRRRRRTKRGQFR